MFTERNLSEMDYVYLWADGIHVNIRLEEHKLCLLVMIGVRADGRKELVALADGYRESTESWADLLRDCKRRGMRAPVLAVGDGALGFWDALREVFPSVREQRCWFHKIGNVLAALPKSAHPGAKKALAEIWNAEDRRHALDAVKAFEGAYGAKFPKAVAKITDDLGELLAFYDYPAQHWVHLRTINPVVIWSFRVCVFHVCHGFVVGCGRRGGHGYLRARPACRSRWRSRCRCNGWRCPPRGCRRGRSWAMTTPRSSRSSVIWPI